MSDGEKDLNLEEALHEISTLIDEMEHSNPTLEQSLDKFERGVSLIKKCQRILQKAEQKVQILTQVNSKEELRDYEKHAE